MKIVIMPRVDEAQKDGTVAEWRKREGDEVKKNEPIAEAMSEKITFDVVTPVSGTLYRIFVKEEIQVPIATAIALIAEPSDDSATLNAAVKKIESELAGLGIKGSRAKEDNS